MGSTFRRLIAFVALAALVFVQAAVAAHLCVGTQMQAVHEAMADPCDSSNHEGAPACASHCENAALSLDQWPGVAFAAPFTPVFVAALALRSATAIEASYADPSLLHATSPPLTIRNCCFRI